MTTLSIIALLIAGSAISYILKLIIDASEKAKKGMYKKPVKITRYFKNGVTYY